MTEQEVLGFLYKIREGCEKTTCFKCIFRSDDVKKCILNNIPEMWDLKKIEYNKQIAK